MDELFETAYTYSKMFKGLAGRPNLAEANNYQPVPYDSSAYIPFDYSYRTGDTLHKGNMMRWVLTDPDDAGYRRPPWYLLLKKSAFDKFCSSKKYYKARVKVSASSFVKPQLDSLGALYFNATKKELQFTHAIWFLADEEANVFAFYNNQQFLFAVAISAVWTNQKLGRSAFDAALNLLIPDWRNPTKNIFPMYSWTPPPPKHVQESKEASLEKPKDWARFSVTDISDNLLDPASVPLDYSPNAIKLFCDDTSRHAHWGKDRRNRPTILGNTLKATGYDVGNSLICYKHVEGICGFYKLYTDKNWEILFDEDTLKIYDIYKLKMTHALQRLELNTKLIAAAPRSLIDQVISDMNDPPHLAFV